MKKIIKIVVVSFLLILFSGCTTSKSYTFSVSTGDKVKISVITNDGYDMTSSTPFNVTKDGKNVSTGTFASKEAYDYYKNAVNSDSSSTLIDSGTKGDTNYFFYEHDGSTKEYNYIIQIENSDTVVILGNTESEESAKNVFENLEISLEE